MYTAEMDVTPWVWNILDPEGVCLAKVSSAEEADSLLSHLNRGLELLLLPLRGVEDWIPAPRPPQ